MFHSIEAPLDAVAIDIGEFIVRNDDLARAVSRDHGFNSHAGDRFPQGIAVIGFIGKHGIAALPLQKHWSLRNVANLTGGDDETQGPALGIGQHVDLGG